MLVTQLHTLVNTVTQEILGESVVVNEDLSNVVDIGNTVFGSDQVDNYVKKLVDHIGKTVFVDRAYAGGVPSVLMDGWEFGSVLEKISTDLPDAQENKSWDLTDGEEYSQDVFKAPNVEAKFFNSKVTFEIQMSFTEKQLKSAFSSAAQLNGFISMLHNSVENSLTVKLDGLIQRAFNNMIGETATDANPIRYVNLLDEYNTATYNTLKADACLSDANFVMWATWKIGVISDRLTKISTLFNVGGKARFTPSDLQNTVLLSDFSKSSETFVLSSTYDGEKATLPKHDTVPYWQGSGTDYGFSDITKVDVKTASGNTVVVTGVLGVIADREAIAVANMDKRTTVAYNARAEFYNNWFKADAQYINDLNENFVVFYVKDSE